MAGQGLNDSLSKNLGSHNININTVRPGVVETSRWDNSYNTPVGAGQSER